MSRLVNRVVLAVGTFVFLLAAMASAQSTTTTQQKKFEVITVTGNQLVVKLPEGTREITVPEGFRFDVDGKQMSVHELKPGMKGMANITTKTTVTPVTVTEVKNGTVMQASGANLIVKTDQGIKMFSPGDVEKRNVKLTQGGQPIDFSSLHAGDKLTATIVTAHPPKVVTEQQVKASIARESGATAGAGKAAAATSGSSGAASSGAAPSGAASKKLPKTASKRPLVGLIGLMSLVTAVALTARRRWQER